MTNELAVPTWLAVATVAGLVVLALVAVALVVSVRRSRRRTDELLAAAAGDAEALREQLAGIEEQLRAQAARAAVPDRGAMAVADDREYVITRLGEESGPRAPARVVPAPAFADILLRESVIKTASLAAGLRRALSPEVRHRIRFEMKREVKRSRRQRRTDLRRARREWEARERAGIEVSS